MPVMLLSSAESPLAVLELPSVLLASAYAPVALLKNPLVLLKSDKTPVAVLKPPLVSLNRARRPVAVFWLPPVRWLSAWKPVPVFQIPPVRLTSTPLPSPLLEPDMAPSVSGPTACRIGASPKQTRAGAMRREPDRKDGHPISTLVGFILVIPNQFSFLLIVFRHCGAGPPRRIRPVANLLSSI